MTAVENYRLEDRFGTEPGPVFLTGIQALARIPMEQLLADEQAGLRTAAFVSGYPGSPLGGLGASVAQVARAQPQLPITFRQGLNEEYAATSVMGSQLSAARPDALFDGVVGIWYGKAPGVDRAADALRHATFAGTSMHGGAVAIVGDDPNAKSSSVPSSSAGLMADMHMPVLYPGDPAEALDLGRHAIMISRATGLWVALKIVADVADATAKLELHPERFQSVMPLIDGQRYQHQPDGALLTPNTLELEREIVEVRYGLARRYAAENGLNEVTVNPADAWLGIMSSGITYREVREALARLGLTTDGEVAAAGIRLLRMGMPMPFNPETVRSFAENLDQVLVVEEKHGLIESLVKDALYRLTTRPVVVGKTDEGGASLVRSWGSLDADDIVPILRRRLERVSDRLVPERKQRERILLPLAVERTPFFCSGCPHNRSTEVPDGTLVGGGVGCHTMSIFMDPDRIGDFMGLTAMGNEGAQWIGMADYVETDHLVQNLGDGTFFHSGQLAIQAAIAANVNITYKLLYNGTVAMTGGQDAEGQLPIARLVPNLLAQGVARVLITTEDVGRWRGRGAEVTLPAGVEVWDRSRLIEAQELLAAVPGTTVLIHDQACAAENRRARKRGLMETPPQRVAINHRICEGCGDCGEVSNCLSVQPMATPFGRKTQIDQTTCNLDFSCLEGDCPSFMTITQEDAPTGWASRLRRRVTHRSTGRGATQAPSPVREPPPVPEPEMIVPVDDFAMRITGIGGTGVVTVAQIIGTAAMLDGAEVSGLDQIGLSQKAGPVVSDVRLLRDDRKAWTNRLGEGQADLLLAFDQLVAASAKGSLTCDSERTSVVGSHTSTPTGHMITHLDIALPSPDELANRISTFTRPGAHWIDAQQVSHDLFGATTTANIFVVGMAIQAGVLPIDARQMERAIELNGVAVEANTQAFRWGRVQIHDPAALEAARAAGFAHHVAAVQEVMSGRLDALSLVGDRRESYSRFARELTAWGNEETAIGWFDVLDEVAATETASVPGSTRVVDAVAAGLYKLTAYKDEYEVARLMTDAEGLAEANDVAGERGSIAWKLHPPMLRALGFDRKITIGAWATPAIRALARRKHLRGSAMDVFGRAEVRRVERVLPGEYLDAVRLALSHLSPSNLETVADLAELPDLVRGYEDIKLANVAIFRERLAGQLAAIRAAG